MDLGLEDREELRATNDCTVLLFVPQWSPALKTGKSFTPRIASA